MMDLYSKDKRWEPALGLEANFLMLNNPDMQYVCAKDPERCYFSNSPSLSELSVALGDSIATKWFVIQFDNLLSSFGRKDDIDEAVIEDVTRNFISNYYWINVSEILLFFSKLKAGVYGQLAYGKITMNDITSKFREFLSERESEMARYTRLQEQRERDIERENDLKTCCSQLDAYKIINSAADGDVEAQNKLQNDPKNWEYRFYVIEWCDDVPIDVKRKSEAYFGISYNSYSGNVVARFENYKKDLFLTGVEKGFYKIIE